MTNTIQRQPLLVQYTSIKVNPLLKMNKDTAIVISRNDKSKQLTLLSQSQLTLTAINNINNKIIGACKKFKNQPRPFVRPSSVNFCRNLLNLYIRQSF
jgi:hypothetical protein